MHMVFVVFILFVVFPVDPVQHPSFESGTQVSFKTVLSPLYYLLHLGINDQLHLALYLLLEAYIHRSDVLGVLRLP